MPLARTRRASQPVFRADSQLEPRYGLIFVMATARSCTDNFHMNGVLVIASRAFLSRAFGLALAGLLGVQALSSGVAEIERLFAPLALAEWQEICRGSESADPAPASHPEANAGCHCCVLCSGNALPPCAPAFSPPVALEYTIARAQYAFAHADRLRDFLSDRIHQPRPPPRAA
jgi:hypothetical protein